MPVERLAPDSILENTGFTGGSLSSIQDDPDSPDANWLTVGTSNVNTVVRVSFPTPTTPLTDGSNLQNFRVQVRKTNHSTHPTCTIQLYENGTLIRATTATTVTATTSLVLSLSWNATEVSDDAQVECRVVGTVGGGGASNRASLEVGAIEWNATINDTTTPKSGTDTHQLAITETAILTGISTTDTQQVTGTDTTISNVVSLSATDTHQLALTEVVPPTTYSDYSNVASGETQQPSTPIAGNDTHQVAVTELAGVARTLSDTHQVAVTETPAIAASSTITDTQQTGITEVLTQLSAHAVTDDEDVVIAESVAVAEFVFLNATDTHQIALTETPVIAQTTTDTQQVISTETTIHVPDLIKHVTFEADTITGTNGFDSEAATSTEFDVNPTAAYKSHFGLDTSPSDAIAWGIVSTPSQNELFVTFRFKLLANPSQRWYIATIRRDTIANFARVAINTDGSVGLYVGTTQFGSLWNGGAALTTGQWYRVGLYAKTSEVTRGEAKAWLVADNEIIDEATPFAENRLLSAPNSFDSVRIGNTTGWGSGYFDDIYVTTDQFPESVPVVKLFPTDTQQLTVTETWQAGLSTTDTHQLATTETATYAALYAAADTSSTAVTDAIVTKIVTQSATDTANTALTDVVQAQANTQEATDTTSTAVTDIVQSQTASVTTTDTESLAITETVISIANAFTVADSSTVTESQTAAIEAASTITDTDDIAITETVQDLTATQSTIDSDDLAVTDSTLIAIAFQAADTQVVAVTDTVISIANAFTVTDSASVAETAIAIINATLSIVDIDNVSITDSSIDSVRATTITDTESVATTESANIEQGVIQISANDTGQIAAIEQTAISANYLAVESGQLALQDTTNLIVTYAALDTAVVAASDTPLDFSASNQANDTGLLDESASTTLAVSRNTLDSINIISTEVVSISNYATLIDTTQIFALEQSDLVDSPIGDANFQRFDELKLGPLTEAVRDRTINPRNDIRSVGLVETAFILIMHTRADQSQVVVTEVFRTPKISTIDMPQVIEQSAVTQAANFSAADLSTLMLSDVSVFDIIYDTNPALLVQLRKGSVDPTGFARVGRIWWY